MTIILNLTFDHSQWQVSRVKQDMLTLPECPTDECTQEFSLHVTRFSENSKK